MKPTPAKAPICTAFGSGKSHFMAVLTLLLQHNPEARFDQIRLEDRNLPTIVEKRRLRPHSAAATRQLRGGVSEDREGA